MSNRHPGKFAAIAAIAFALCSGFALADDVQRRRPGDPAIRAVPSPLPDPNARSGLGRLPRADRLAASQFIALPDRWRLTRDLGLVNERWWDPYHRNLFKGDRPFAGAWFVNLGVIADSKLTLARQPTRADANGLSPAALRNAGLARRQFGFNQTVLLSANVYEGETVFKPPMWDLRAAVALNYTVVDAGTRGVTARAADASSRRADSALGLQALSLRRHLRTVSDNYDFDAIEIGIQPVNADPRGFLLFDNVAGVRVFGTRAANVWQYAIGWFRRLEKNTNSGLNEAELRDEDIVMAQVSRHDWPRDGLRSAIALVHHRDRATDRYVDDNGFIVRPHPAFANGPRKQAVSYIGASLDGHIDWLNLTATLYKAEGDAYGRGADERIDGWLGALELSRDVDWIRFRLSLLFATGDDTAADGERNGFDAVSANPLFAGADTSVWIGDSIPLLSGPRLALSRSKGLLPALRSPGPHGGSNFINPGLLLAGLGADLDVLPRLRVVLNANRLAFHDTSSLRAPSGLANVDAGLGWDLSGAVIYRPAFSQNAVVRLSGGVLVPSAGLRAIAGDDLNTVVQANVVLRY